MSDSRGRLMFVMLGLTIVFSFMLRFVASCVIVCCLLFVVCCLLFVVCDCYLLCVVCCVALCCVLLCFVAHVLCMYQQTEC